MIRAHGAVVGRILLGLLFFASGASILFMSGVSGTASMIEMKGLPMAMLLAWVVVLVKIVAGGALMLGREVQKAALALMAFTILATLFYHMDMQDINLFKNLAIIGGLMYAYLDADR